MNHDALVTAVLSTTIKKSAPPTYQGNSGEPLVYIYYKEAGYWYRECPKLKARNAERERDMQPTVMEEFGLPDLLRCWNANRQLFTTFLRIVCPLLFTIDQGGDKYDSWACEDLLISFPLQFICFIIYTLLISIPCAVLRVLLIFVSQFPELSCTIYNPLRTTKYRRTFWALKVNSTTI